MASVSSVEKTPTSGASGASIAGSADSGNHFARFLDRTLMRGADRGFPTSSEGPFFLPDYPDGRMWPLTGTTMNV